MNGLPPSICPTGLYTPPDRPPLVGSDIPRDDARGPPPGVVLALIAALALALVCASLALA